MNILVPTLALVVLSGIAYVAYNYRHNRGEMSGDFSVIKVPLWLARAKKVVVGNEEVRLNASDKLLLSVLIQLDGENNTLGEDKGWHLSQEDLAELIGASRSTTYKGIKLLEDAGLISVVREARDGYRRNFYTEVIPNGSKNKLVY